MVNNTRARDGLAVLDGGEHDIEIGVGGILARVIAERQVEASGAGGEKCGGEIREQRRGADGIDERILWSGITQIQESSSRRLL